MNCNLAVIKYIFKTDKIDNGDCVKANKQTNKSITSIDNDYMERLSLLIHLIHDRHL